MPARPVGETAAGGDSAGALDDLCHWTRTRAPGVAAAVRVRRLAAALAVPAPPLAVKVTGTNGKGSVCAMLDATLRSAGYRVGLFTSPHLVCPEERIRIDGHSLSRPQLDTAAAELSAVASNPAVDPLLVPSFFEALLLMALREFHRASVDVAILEAGIGGARDATSAVEGPVSAITSLGADHLDLLGPSLDDVARDKAGLASEDSVLVLGPHISGPPLHAIEREAQQRRLVLVRTSLDDVRGATCALDGTRCEMRWGESWVDLHLNLAGRHQLANLVVVRSMLCQLAAMGRPAGEDALRGLTTVGWPCRLQLFEGIPRWLLDGAHNPAALDTLASSLDELVPWRDRVLVFGMTRDRLTPDAARAAVRLAPRIHPVGGFHRSAAPGEVAAGVPSTSLEPAFDTPRDAVSSLAARPDLVDRVIVVAGSLFLCGATLEALKADRGATIHMGGR
jgi:folylpolyglutamate synthase/dihydrofolate synthase